MPKPTREQKSIVFNDNQLRSIVESRSQFGRDAGIDNMVRSLALQLIGERQLNRAMVEGLVRANQRLREFNAGKWQDGMGRILIVEVPSIRADDEGSLVIYSDPGIHIAHVATGSDLEDSFEAQLEAELATCSKRFDGMPWELTSRVETSWPRKKKRVETKDATQARKLTTEKNADQTKEQQAKRYGAKTPLSAQELPF